MTDYCEIVKLFFRPRTAYAALTWPCFSVTSYGMVSSLVKQGLKPKTVIDVGANIGQFSICAAKLFPDTHVHSFEPNPDCLRLLNRNVASLKNVSVYSVALGNEEGGAILHINSYSHSSSMLPLGPNHLSAFPQAKAIGDILVTQSTLDKIFSAVLLSRFVLLKIDVQGYEAQVLRGASQLLTRIDWVILEVSFKSMYYGEPLFMDVVALMESYGFSILRPIGLLRDPTTGEIIQMDVLFRRNVQSGDLKEVNCCSFRGSPDY